MIGWLVAGTLYVLGAAITTTHHLVRRERGMVYLALLLLWPISAIIGLVSLPGALLFHREIARGKDHS